MQKSCDFSYSFAVIISNDLLVERLTSPFSTNWLYPGQGLGWRFSSTRLRMANGTVISRPRCLFVQQRRKMGKDRGGSFKYTSTYNRVETNQPPQDLFISSMIYLSVQCNILCNCCPPVPITYQ